MFSWGLGYLLCTRRGIVICFESPKTVSLDLTIIARGAHNLYFVLYCIYYTDMVIYYKIQCLKIYILSNPAPMDLITLKYNLR